MINELTLSAGDAITIEDTTSIKISTKDQAEILLFDIHPVTQ
jgi:hypothetical protein